MSKTFKCWRYSDDLDKSVTKNARDTKTAYAIWVRDGLEPDEQYLGKSTNQADPDMKIGVTLLERMIMEIKCFVWTGKHLDVKGVTFCTGSRYSDGFVPYVDWYSGGREVLVDWCNLDYSGSDYGLRSVVS
jgi:membrane-bound inhibitor of C-type lysozyme